MTEDNLFDNLYIGHSLEDAQKVEEKAEAEEAGDFQTILKNDPVGFVREKVLEFVEIAEIDFVFAARAMPEVAAPVALFFAGALFSLLVGGSSSKPSAVSSTSPVVSTKDRILISLFSRGPQEERCPHSRR